MVKKERIMQSKEKELRLHLNKKGWIRIVEAVVAIMLLAGFLTFILVSRNNKTDLNDYAYNIETSIVRDISMNDSLRTDILSNNTLNVNSYIQGRIPATFNFSSRICTLEEVCGCTNCPLDKDVYADSAFISSTISSYKPVQFKLFIWGK